MNITFKNRKLQKILTDPGEIKKAYGSMANRVSQRMDQLQAAPNLATIQSLPTLECHLLTGDRKGEWAVRISGNYRLIFDIDHTPIPTKEDGVSIRFGLLIYAFWRPPTIIDYLFTSQTSHDSTN